MKSDTRKVTFILTGIIAVSAALRLYAINFQSLWVDELFSIIPTDPNNSLMSVIEAAKRDQPPLFFIYLYYVFKAFGYGEAIGRIACAFIGLLSIPAVYFLVKEVQSQSAGLFAALITGFNYFHLYYSQELRFYTMLFLFTTLSYLFFLRAYRRGRLIDFVGYTISTICLQYTHYFGILIFFTQFLTFLILLKYKRDRKFVLSSLLSGIVAGLSFLPWLPVILNDVGFLMPWIKVPSPFFLAEYFYDYTGKDAFTTVVFVFFIFLFIRSIVKGESAVSKAINITILIWIVIPYLFPYLRSVIVGPMLTIRYTIVTLPAWFLIFSISWDNLKNVRWKYAVAIMLPLAAMINLAFFKQHYTRLTKDQFREASELVISKNQLHYPIYAQQPWHFNFYFRNSVDKVTGLNRQNMPQAEKFWLLQANLWPEHADEELKYLDSNFKITDQYHLFKADAYLMERK